MDEKMEQKIHDIFFMARKYREMIVYGIVGGMTTVLNLALYTAMVSCLQIHYVSADIIAWIICFIFSFVTNKFLVFSSQVQRGTALIKELIRFFTSSLFTGIIEVVFLYLLVDWFGWNSQLSKLIDTVLIIILNYILRKFWVFTKGEQQGE